MNDILVNIVVLKRMSARPKNLTELLLKSIIVRNRVRDDEFNELQKRYQELVAKCAPNICSNCKQHCGGADSDFEVCNYVYCNNRYCYANCAWNDECIIDGICIDCIKKRCCKCESADIKQCANCSLRVCSKHAFSGPDDYVACSNECQNSMYTARRHEIMLAAMY